MPNDLNGNITEEDKLNQNLDNDGLVKSEEVSKEAKETVNKVKEIYTKGKYNEDVKNLENYSLKKLRKILLSNMNYADEVNELGKLRREYNEVGNGYYDRLIKSNNFSYAVADDYNEEEKEEKLPKAA